MSDLLGGSEERLFGQDWEDACVQAEKVNSLRPDLAWPYTVMGREAERRGDLARCAEVYLRGLRILGTSADFTDGWASREDGGYLKFAAARLWAVRPELPLPVARDPYLEAAMRHELDERWVSPIRAHWIAAGERAEREGRLADAYQCYYAAGWDEYFTNDMEEVLDRLVRVAESPTLQSLARRHREGCVSLLPQ